MTVSVIEHTKEQWICDIISAVRASEIQGKLWKNNSSYDNNGIRHGGNGGKSREG
jgi:hypothetical protein